MALIPRETRNSFFPNTMKTLNTSTLLSTVIQYNTEKIIEDEMSNNKKKVLLLKLTYNVI